MWALSAFDMDGIGVKKNSIMKLPYVTGRPYPLDAAQILEGLTEIALYFLKLQGSPKRKIRHSRAIDCIKDYIAHGLDLRKVLRQQKTPKGVSKR